MVRKIIPSALSRPLERRQFLKGATLLGAAGAFPAIITRRGFAQDKPTVVNSIRSLSNPYHATWNKGGAAFAKSVGAEYVTLVTEGNSEKGIADIKAILAKTGGNCVINVDPNDSPDARPIVEAVEGCRRLRRHAVEQAGRPASLGFRSELRRAHLVQRRSLRQGDGRGADQGDGRQGRHRRARRHRVQRAGNRTQGWPRGSAQGQSRTSSCSTCRWPTGRRPKRWRKTNAWLTQFGDEIGGIWAANDDMALAAVEALRADGRAGKVPVTGIDGIQLAVEAILKGEMAGTVAWDPFWQGGMGLSIGYQAKTGKFDPSKEGKEHREFYGTGVTITAENAQSFYDTNIKAEPQLDWNDIWGRASGQIKY